LQRLRSAQNRDGGWFFGVGGSAFSAAEQFYFIIEPGNGGQRGAARDFWLGTFLDQMPDTDCVEGFATGAMDVWNEVTEQVIS
jgi:hypothetical protein